MNKDIFMNLNWDVPVDIQEKAINEIVSIVDLNPKSLIQPLSKEYWENAAKVLYKMGYPRIKEAIPGLLVWLQDMNWPGARTVIEVLESLPRSVFVPCFEWAVKEAISTDDEIWLINLSVFVIKFQLEKHEFVSKKVYLALLDIREDFCF